MKGKMNGKRRRERPRESDLGNMKNIPYLSNYEEIKRLANRREDWLKRQSL